MLNTPPPCPVCASHAVIPIIYGMPDADLVARDQAGEAKIGGVATYAYSPEWHCRDCQHEWRSSSSVDTAGGAMDEAEQAILKAQLEGNEADS